MKVVIDHSLCEGHARCMETVPEVFEVRDDDRSYALMDDIPHELRPKIERADMEDRRLLNGSPPEPTTDVVTPGDRKNPGT